MYYIYILKCSDGSLYTGITTDLKRRLAEHNGLRGTKLGARYTASRRLVEMVYSQKFKNRSDASKAETRVKKMTRLEKLTLIDLKT